jgi:hypothetical protein
MSSGFGCPLFSLTSGLLPALNIKDVPWSEIRGKT